MAVSRVGITTEGRHLARSQRGSVSNISRILLVEISTDVSSGEEVNLLDSYGSLERVLINLSVSFPSVLWRGDGTQGPFSCCEFYIPAQNVSSKVHNSMTLVFIFYHHRLFI